MAGSARGRGRGARRPAPLGPGRPSAVGEREVLLGELGALRRVAERNERLGGVDAPAGDAGVPDAELGPAVGGGEQVGVRVRVAVLGEPQAGAALEQQRRAQRRRAADRRSWPARQGGVGIVELVELDQRVDEREQRPEHAAERRGGELVVEARAARRPRRRGSGRRARAPSRA